MQRLRWGFQVEEAGIESAEALHAPMVCPLPQGGAGIVTMGDGVRKSTGLAMHMSGGRWQTSHVRRTRGPHGPRGSTRPKLGTMMSEQTVYGAHSSSHAAPRTKTRVHHLQKMKAEGHKWAMLTAYDYSTARVFDDAGIPVLLVGDSAANVVYVYYTTVPVSSDDLIPLVHAVVRGAPHALVVADLPFGSYEAGPAAALDAAIRFMKEAGAHAVKLEGGERVADQIPAPAAGSRAAATLPSRPSPTRSRSPRPARSRWSWRWCRQSWPPRSPAS